ncbi:M56 family metallopeptidase [Larkinella punicea]|uniref:POTRA domain-containing protein n=1 Tax=Larkinella punicea TaxID=2315727 RepID=A0A368JR74_9BACT|nr:M56 family metallopeptidase [Larkinella punicea]RCR69466.1 hypothetical protein DUE52_11480 [Larkinella punicea]
MLTNFFLYLVQSSVAISTCALVYRLFLCRLTYFQWNRVYLLGSLLLSLAIPVLLSTGLFNEEADPGVISSLPLNWSKRSVNAFLPTRDTTSTTLSSPFWEYLLLTLYLVGCLYKTWHFAQNLKTIFKLIPPGQPIWNRASCRVFIQSRWPTFSFLNCIFLHSGISALTHEEQEQVLQHEEVHVRQRHSLDVLLYELAGIVFWFNPIVTYLSVSIRQVHEYIVDEVVTRANNNVRMYGYLLLKLTTQPSFIPILNTFSNKQIFQRIQMLTQTRSRPIQKLTFLIVLPLLVLTLVLCSFLQPFNSRTRTVTEAEKPATGIPIGTILWKGNTVYSAEKLTQILGVREGDLYNKEHFKKRFFDAVGTDVASLYMDKGYLYFNVDVQESRSGNVVNLILTVFEGSPVTIGKITFKGNKDVTEAQIHELIAIRLGELFNRSKLLKSQQKLAESGYFNPKKIGINPVPNPELKTVDLVYVLDRKP